MPRDSGHRTLAHPHVQNPQHKRKSPVPISLSTVQWHMPNRDFVIATGTLVTVNFCFKIAALSCFIRNETMEMLQQQDTLYFRYITMHMHFQIIKINCMCRQRHLCKLMLLHKFLPDTDKFVLPGNTIIK